MLKPNKQESALRFFMLTGVLFVIATGYLLAMGFVQGEITTLCSLIAARNTATCAATAAYPSPSFTLHAVFYAAGLALGLFFALAARRALRKIHS